MLWNVALNVLHEPVVQATHGGSALNEYAWNKREAISVTSCDSLTQHQVTSSFQKKKRQTFGLAQDEKS